MTSVKEKEFGSLNGTPVRAFEIESEDVKLVILNYGGIIQSLRTKDKNGDWDDIVTGFDTIEEYPEKSNFFGCLVGRYANRIGHGKFSLNGRSYELFKNNGGNPPRNALHGGKVGFDKKFWNAKIVENGLELKLISEDGDEGYPGKLDVTVTYSLVGGAFSIKYEATADADTVVNLTNHTYFNLDGHINWSTLDNHSMTIHADNFVDVDEFAIPKGGLTDVTGTKFDLRKGQLLTQDFLASVPGGNGIDHNLCIKTFNCSSFVKIAEAVSEKTGRKMLLEGTQPGVQFYTGNFLPGKEGKGGVNYAKQTAFCVETQHFPDSPNRPEFPNAVLKAGEKYEHLAKFTFSAE
ncbi:Oidioi.mRNA.OKI2018_I69.chr1.g579.t1.cds [Oikopleura dioica]|uniref:Aldose 1-epimerase n=1 Tax=Oikopleura dioica TaxID=34765 RepID=A0ABN7SRK5_OIKDI|nr:Oidioi.mRNA.OKI2018_I69.chr1.g579.t1.cds [Oikopleura dioica]